MRRGQHGQRAAWRRVPASCCSPPGAPRLLGALCSISNAGRARARVTCSCPEPCRCLPCAAPDVGPFGIVAGGGSTLCNHRKMHPATHIHKVRDNAPVAGLDLSGRVEQGGSGGAAALELHPPATCVHLQEVKGGRKETRQFQTHLQGRASSREQHLASLVAHLRKTSPAAYRRTG